MISKLVLKKMTRSDLTLFDWGLSHGGKISIDLDANVFVDKLYPAITKATSGRRWIPLDLWIFGPGNRAGINLQRKIYKGILSRNWQLGGELVKNPTTEADRFNSLLPGDFVILCFEGDIVPSKATALFVDRSFPEDFKLHSVLETLGLSGRDTMRILDEELIAKIAASAGLPEDHPLAGFALSNELQEAALGSAAAAERLLRCGQVPNLSATALRRARQQADEIGRLGEALIAVRLEQQKGLGLIRSYEWVSEANAVAPMDFRISPMEGAEERIDAKTTAGQFDRPVHISWSELREMAAEVDGPYRVYRVYAAGEQGAKLRISTNLKSFAQGILAQMAGLASGVTVDSFSVDPSGIQFESEIGLASPAEDEDQ